jgi:hypothetical protein
MTFASQVCNLHSALRLLWLSQSLDHSINAAWWNIPTSQRLFSTPFKAKCSGGDSSVFLLPAVEPRWTLLKMLDPFFPPPPGLSALVQPLADKLGLPIISLHIHEILISFIIYHIINTRLAPTISRWLFPDIYNNLNARTKVNWDVHVVSLAQSTVINILALWVIFYDEERKAMSWRERVWGYTGAAGMVQGFAAGYFLWDLMVSTANVPIFGWGLLAHAICALVVFSLGFVRYLLSIWTLY